MFSLQTQLERNAIVGSSNKIMYAIQDNWCGSCERDMCQSFQMNPRRVKKIVIYLESQSIKEGCPCMPLVNQDVTGFHKFIQIGRMII